MLQNFQESRYNGRSSYQTNLTRTCCVRVPSICGTDVKSRVYTLMHIFVHVNHLEVKQPQGQTGLTGGGGDVRKGKVEVWG